MPDIIQLGSIAVDVIKKDIKNVHLSVYPPAGKVRISAPRRMDLDTIRVFAVSKLGWIKQEQKKITAQKREPPREYVDRESHYLWGKRYLLRVIETEDAPRVERQHRRIVIHTRPLALPDFNAALLESWYRAQLREAVPPLVAKWQPLIGVTVRRFFVQRMKTRWGTCNHHAGTIRLNTDLAKKPRECLEYIVVHEMVHILEPTHNARFTALMDQYLPQWHANRQMLNGLPLRHESWGY